MKFSFYNVRAKIYNWVLFFLILSRILIIWNYFIILKYVFLKMNFYKNNFLDDKENKYIYIIVTLQLLMRKLYIYNITC